MICVLHADVAWYCWILVTGISAHPCRNAMPWFSLILCAQRVILFYQAKIITKYSCSFLVVLLIARLRALASDDSSSSGTTPFLKQVSSQPPWKCTLCDCNKQVSKVLVAALFTKPLQVGQCVRSSDSWLLGCTVRQVLLQPALRWIPS